MVEVNKFLSEEQERQIIDAIRDAESKTSGEIRVHIENYCSSSVLDRAANVFTYLKMHKTRLRNGVLIYIALKDHKFAIIGDQGIDNTVKEGFWESTKTLMEEYFRKGNLVEGLVHGIRKAGKELQAHFPAQNDDGNELPDNVSMKDN